MRSSCKILLFMAAFLDSVIPGSCLEIIAHRGASHEAPENTVAAVRQAWKQSSDAVEIDIHLSRDGQIVVMHDATAERTAGDERKISEMSLDEIRALDAGTWKNREYAGEKVPLLDEILALIPPGKRLYIEVKCGREIVPELVCALERAGKPGREVCIISFDWDLLRELKKQIPQYEAFWIRGYDANIGIEEAYREFIKRCRDADLDGIDLSHAWPLDARWMKEFREAGLKVLAWTVDDPVVARRLTELGVDGITTNRPGWLRDQLDQPDQLGKGEALTGKTTY